MDVTITDSVGKNQALNLLSSESYYSYRYTPSKAGNYTLTAVANGDPAKKVTKSFNIQGTDDNYFNDDDVTSNGYNYDYLESLVLGIVSSMVGNGADSINITSGSLKLQN